MHGESRKSESILASGSQISKGDEKRQRDPGAERACSARQAMHVARDGSVRT